MSGPQHMSARQAALVAWQSLPLISTHRVSEARQVTVRYMPLLRWWVVLI